MLKDRYIIVALFIVSALFSILAYTNFRNNFLYLKLFESILNTELSEFGESNSINSLYPDYSNADTTNYSKLILLYFGNKKNDTPLSKLEIDSTHIVIDKFLDKLGSIISIPCLPEFEIKKPKYGTEQLNNKINHFNLFLKLKFTLQIYSYYRQVTLDPVLNLTMNKSNPLILALQNKGDSTVQLDLGPFLNTREWNRTNRQYCIKIMTDSLELKNSIFEIPKKFDYLAKYEVYMNVK